MAQQAVAAYDLLVRPSKKWMTIPILLGFNLLLVACSYLTVHLPFSPVPITGQTLGVLIVAMVLGRARGTAVVAAYLAEGAMGLPVFAGGKAGAVALLGPTGGYLAGFLAAAYVVGYLSDKGWYRTYFASVLAMIVGTVAIFACGLTWLGIVVPEGALLSMGLWPFLPGAAIKIAVAAVILPSVYRFMKKDY